MTGQSRPRHQSGLTGLLHHAGYASEAFTGSIRAAVDIEMSTSPAGLPATVAERLAKIVERCGPECRKALFVFRRPDMSIGPKQVAWASERSSPWQPELK